MKKETYVIIMAGGKSERFWPFSKSGLTKPFLKLIDGKSLIELTYMRAKRIVPEDRIFFVLAKEHVEGLIETIPNLSIDRVIVEPEGRDTAACIGYSALHLKEISWDSTMVVFPSDHYISGEEIFENAVNKAIKLAEEGDYLVIFGIRPTRPEVGYGYIKVGKIKEEGEISVYEVEKFVEKPSYEMAKKYYESGQYYWNSGIFVWKTKVILEELRKYLPDLFSSLEECIEQKRAGDTKKLSAIYSNLQRISIDYGVMEKSKNVIMVKGDFVWDDVGTWSALFRILKKDQNSNVKVGDAFTLDVHGSLIFSENVNLGVLGLKDVIVVATNDGVLVLSHEYAQNVRDVAKYFSRDDI